MVMPSAVVRVNRWWAGGASGPPKGPEPPGPRCPESRPCPYKAAGTRKRGRRCLGILVIRLWEDRCMGTHNRDRRRQKKRRQEAAARARERRRAEANGLPGSDLDAADIERLLFTAVAAHRDGHDDVEYEVAELLAL